MYFCQIFSDYMSWNEKEETFDYNVTIVDLSRLCSSSSSEEKEDNDDINNEYKKKNKIDELHIVKFQKELFSLTECNGGNFALFETFKKHYLLSKKEFPFEFINLKPISLYSWKTNQRFIECGLIEKIRKNRKDYNDGEPLPFSLEHFPEFQSGEISKNIDIQLKNMNFELLSEGFIKIPHWDYIEKENDGRTILKFNYASSFVGFIMRPAYVKTSEYYINDVVFTDEKIQLFKNDCLNYIIPKKPKLSSSEEGEDNNNDDDDDKVTKKMELSSTFSKIKMDELVYERWFLECFQSFGEINILSNEFLFLMDLISTFTKKMFIKSQDVNYFPLISCRKTSLEVSFNCFLIFKYFMFINNNDDKNNNNDIDSLSSSPSSSSSSSLLSHTVDNTLIPIPKELNVDFLKIQELHYCEILNLSSQINILLSIENCINDNKENKRYNLIDIETLKRIYYKKLEDHKDEIKKYILQFIYITSLISTNYCLSFVRYLTKCYLEQATKSSSLSLVHLKEIDYSIKKIEIDPTWDFHTFSLNIVYFNYYVINTIKENYSLCLELNIFKNNDVNKILKDHEDYLSTLKKTTIMEKDGNNDNNINNKEMEEELKNNGFIHYLTLYYMEFLITLDKELSCNRTKIEGDNNDDNDNDDDDDDKSNKINKSAGKCHREYSHFMI